MSEQSRRRLVVVQVLVLSLVATLLGRLWYLQVLAGGQYQAAASDNRIRQVVTPSVRGVILDDMGRPLAQNRTAMVVSVSPTVLLHARDGGRALLTKLSRVLHVPFADLWEQTRICDYSKPLAGQRNCWNGSPFQPIPVSDSADTAAAQTILERQEEFPGVTAEMRAVRTYPKPDGSNAAHVLGYLGRVSPQDVATAKQAGVALQGSDLIGKSGLESQYDAVLRGKPGIERLAVDRYGAVTGTVGEQPPTPGDYLVTSIDAKVQAVTERALADAIHAARTTGDPNKHGRRGKADSGAAVVMDVTNGRIVAMASYPTYDPDLWNNGVISTRQFAALNSQASNYPLISRAFQGQFAPGSAFKVVSVMAAARAGYDLNGVYDCPPSYQVGNRSFGNYESEAFGPVTLRRGIEVSCDTLWYQVAYQQWLADGGTAPHQPKDWFLRTAVAGGLGAPTGIDLPDESPGLIETRQFKVARWKNHHEVWCTRGKQEQATARTYHDRLVAAIDLENCQDYYQYRPGDAVNFAIGQGGTTLTPLQLARLYAAVANGGTLWVPQIAKAVVTPDGRVVRQFAPKAAGRLPASPSTLAWLRTTLLGVTTQGTGAGPFAGFPLGTLPVATKTGTAEVAGKDTTSVFASFAPENAPRYAVVMLISQGGTGSGISGPGVRKIYDALYGVSGGSISSAKAVLPGGVPPVALPRVAADGSILPPGSRLPASPSTATVLGTVPATPARNRAARRRRG